jgi:predicted MFS family arabinose efflux permease
VRFGILASAAPPALATAVGISVASHLAVYALTPIFSLHLIAIGGTAAQVGLLFSVFSIVAVVLRPMAGAWIDRQGVHQALIPGAALIVLTSLGFHAARQPGTFIALTAGFGIGYGLVTMAAAVLAASAPPEQRGKALSIYYLAAPVSMAVAAPIGLWLFREVGAGANFLCVTLLGVASAAFALSPRSTISRAPVGGGARLWSRGATPLSAVLVVAAMAQSALYAFLPLHASAHGHERDLTWFFGLYSVLMVTFRLGVSNLADRWGRGQLLVPALLFTAAGFGTLVAPPSSLRLALAAMLLAAGSSALYPMLVALVVDRVPDRERGVAMGMVSGAWDLGIFAGSLTLAAVVERGSLGAAFAAASALSLLALGGLLVVERRPAVARAT